MKYHIDTIPVWDALKLGGECPLCALRRKQEHLSTERFLGASVMQPDVRIAVNKVGFCPRHQKLLYEKQDKLGHALLMHSHLTETRGKLAPILEKAEAAARNEKRAHFLIRLRRGGPMSCLQDVAHELDTLISHCIICEYLAETMNGYAYTLFHLFKTDSEFRKMFGSSKGVCLKDASALLKLAENALSGNMLIDFVCTLSRLTSENLARVENEVEWFTLKADYRNTDKSWGTSRDALERAVTRLRGWCIGAEPYPKEK